MVEKIRYNGRKRKLTTACRKSGVLVLYYSKRMGYLDEEDLH